MDSPQLGVAVSLLNKHSHRQFSIEFLCPHWIEMRPKTFFNEPTFAKRLLGNHPNFSCQGPEAARSGRRPEEPLRLSGKGQSWKGRREPCGARAGLQRPRLGSDCTYLAADGSLAALRASRGH